MLRASGAILIARERDAVEEGNHQLRDFTTHGVDVVSLKPDWAGGWRETRAHWPIAGYAGSGTAERCPRAYAASASDATRAKSHALLPPTPRDDTPVAVIASARQVPVGWREVAPMTSHDDLICANNSREWWTLADREGSLVVSRHQERHTLQMARAGGELVGFDHGEFGGRIEWIGQDGVRELVDGDVNPVAMVEHGDAVLVATGLAHLSIDAGDIRRLQRGADGHWHATPWLDLGAASLATYRIDARTWRIVTTRGVVDVDLDGGTLHSVHANADWGILYPTSIRPLGDAWFIGARHAVIRLAPGKDGLEERWWVKSACKPL